MSKPQKKHSVEDDPQHVQEPSTTLLLQQPTINDTSKQDLKNKTRTKTKTRSRQKNIRKDRREDHAKPPHLRVGQQTYTVLPLTSSTKVAMELDSKATKPRMAPIVDPDRIGHRRRALVDRPNRIASGDKI